MRFYFSWLILGMITALLIIPGCTEGPPSDPTSRVEAYFDVTPLNGTVNTTFLFDASATKVISKDPSVVTCSWDFDGDGTFEFIDTSCNVPITHQFDATGAYEVYLEAKATVAGWLREDYYTRTIAVTSDTNVTSGCYDNYHSYCFSQPTVNYGGKVYKTAQIGNQCWLAENLNVGETVVSDSIPADNGVIEKLCVDDSPSNCDSYGGLYTWDEAMNYSGAPRGICPPGWHIPTLADWDELADHLGGYGDAAGWKMMSCEGDPWNLGANTTNNESGFTAFPTGYYWLWFDWQTQRAYYWSSDPYDADRAYYKYLDFQQGFVGPTTDAVYDWKSNSMCIRCIKD